MTERRTTITRGWRPAGAPARRVDDFQEVPAEPEPTKPAPPARQVERRNIGRRLENWGAWANGVGHGSNRGGSGITMTGIICESMRRAALGNVWSGHDAPTRIDVPDAERMNRAFIALPEIHREVLHWTYVAGAKPWGVAGACGFPTREYEERLAAAQVAIESIVEKNMERMG